MNFSMQIKGSFCGEYSSNSTSRELNFNMITWMIFDNCILLLQLFFLIKNENACKAFLKKLQKFNKIFIFKKQNSSLTIEI